MNLNDFLLLTYTTHDGNEVARVSTYADLSADFHLSVNAAGNPPAYATDSLVSLAALNAWAAEDHRAGSVRLIPDTLPSRADAEQLAGTTAERALARFWSHGECDDFDTLYVQFG